jgi:alpha-1,3-rhamnosyl/mannosyltransferase
MWKPVMWKRLRAALHRLRTRLQRRVWRLAPSRWLATCRWLLAVGAAVRRRRRQPGLTVAVDIAPFWESLTGIGWYLYRVLEHLAREEGLRLRLYGPTLAEHLVDSVEEPAVGPAVAPPRGPAIEWVRYPIPHDLTLPPGLLDRLLFRLRPLLIAADGNRILFAPNYNLPRPFLLARGRLVATVHDLGFLKVPWTLQAETLEGLKRRLGKTLGRSQHILTPSESVRQEILAAGMAGPGRVTAVHHGPGQLADVRPGDLPPGTPSPFALHVGTIEPRKDLITILEAWKSLVASGETVPTLVLCGRLGWKSEELAQQLREAEEGGWLRHFGYVDNPRLAALYHQAQFVVFPTVYEGFGLPALEAQWAGTPLLCSDLPVLREVAGEGALFVPPQEPAAWAQALLRLSRDEGLRQELSAQGRRHAGQFSWQRSAAETLAVFRRVAGQQPTRKRREPTPSETRQRQDLAVEEDGQPGG